MSNRYQEAKERYAKLGVDTEEAIRRLQNVSLSMHCWQGDDVRGLQDASENTRLMVLSEELKFYPYADVWAEFCERCGVAADEGWFSEISHYEKDVLQGRN